MDLLLRNLFDWTLQVTLLVAVAALAARSFTVDAATVRYAWWRLVLVSCLALPLMQPWHLDTLRTSMAIDQSTMLRDLSHLRAGSVHGPSILRRLSASLPPWRTMVVVALALGAGLRLLWLSAGLVYLRRLRSRGVLAPANPTDPESALEGPTRPVDVRYVDGIGQPITFGLRHPVVLLPSSIRALPESVQRAALVHELWHVRRRDWLRLVGEEGLRALLWFEPAIWWLISRVQSSREEVVDELTLRVIKSRRHYLEALLAFADRPALFPAAPFARRQHLYQRMLLVSREAVMSSRRTVVSCAGMAVAVVVAGWYGVAAFPLQAAPQATSAQAQQPPPRDPRPGAPRPATARETELQKAIQSGSADAAVYGDVARLQEQRGAITDAEATLIALRQLQPNDAMSYAALAGLYQRTGQFDLALTTVEQAAALNPADPNGYQILATFYWDKASKDQTLTPAAKASYIQRGIAATDRALALQPDFVDSLVYKNIFLRMEAQLESDPGKRQALLTEADALRTRALSLRPVQQRAVPTGAGAPPPPPPPPPPLSQDDWAAKFMVDGKTPVRLGAAVAPPRGRTDVKAAYPEVAMNAGVQGEVVVDAVIDTAGNVTSTRVVKSIPLLDQAALDAIKQWKFVPAMLNGAPTPVVVTMTVNFTLK